MSQSDLEIRNCGATIKDWGVVEAQCMIRTRAWKVGITCLSNPTLSTCHAWQPKIREAYDDVFS